MYFIALVLTAASLVAQAPAPTDFNGTWKMLPDRSGSAEQSVPITEMTFVIEQTPATVRLDITSGHDRTITVSYPFGPTPKAPGEEPGPGEKRAYWQDKALTIERGGTISGQTVSSKQTLSLSADGSEMTVERVVVVQHGYTLRGTRNYATVKDVFVRVP